MVTWWTQRWNVWRTATRRPWAPSPTSDATPSARDDRAERRSTLRRANMLGLGPLLLVLLLGSALAQSGASTNVNTAAALVQALEHGGVVTIEPGVYVLDETLVLRGQVELRALEADTVQLRLRSAPLGVSIEPGAAVRLVGLALAYDAEAPGDVLWIRDANVTLEDVEIGFAVGGFSDLDERLFGLGSGMVASGAANVRVAGGGFGQHQGFAIEVLDGSNVHLDDVVLVRNVAGIHVDGEASLTMLGGELRSHVGGALHVRGRARASVTSALVEDSGSLGCFSCDAVRVSDEAEAEFHDVVFAYNPRFALSLHGRASVLVVESLFEHNGSAEGEVLVSAVSIADDAELVVRGSWFSDHPGGAIEAVGAARLTLEGVTIERTGSWAHTYVGERSSVHVVGGTFSGNEGSLFVGDAASGVLEDVVMIGDGGAEGVGLFAAGFAELDVRGGRIEDHGAFGVYLLGSSRASVEGTTLRGNRSGLVAADTSTLLARGVVAIDQERSGMGFLDASQGEVSGSTLSDNGWVGVVLAGEAVADVFDNLFAGNGQRGAWFDEAAGGRFGGNTVSASPVGLEIAADASVEVGDNTFADVGEALVRD